MPAQGAVGPFCSERCRLIDLGAWLTDGARAIPDRELGDATQADADDDDPTR